MTGEASVTSRPDRVVIDLGVVTRGSAAQQASNVNARAAQNVIASLQKALGPKATIETISYVVRPDYQYPPQGGEPKITGYTATHLVRVTEDDISNVGTVIDAATRAGANIISQIRFTLKDATAATAAALRGAAYDARTKANTLASAFGLQVVRVQAVDEASPIPRPMFDVALRAGAEATPIIPSSIETTATVTLSVEVTSHRAAEAANHR